MELSFVFLSGLLGSAHCVGMCGPFVLLIAAPRASGVRQLGRQLTYTLGRVFVYVALGGMAAFAGWRLEQLLPFLRQGASLLSCAAGLVLVYEGLRAAGVWRPQIRLKTEGCLTQSLLAPFLRQPGTVNVFLAGMLTGLLPCGFLYAFLALAASTRHMLHGGLLMGTFALGTAPALILFGCGGSWASGLTRRRILRLAAWCMMVTGGLAIYRGVYSWTSEDTEGSPACPFCQSGGVGRVPVEPRRRPSPPPIHPALPLAPARSPTESAG